MTFFGNLSSQPREVKSANPYYDADLWEQQFEWEVKRLANICKEERRVVGFFCANQWDSDGGNGFGVNILRCSKEHEKYRDRCYIGIDYDFLMKGVPLEELRDRCERVMQKLGCRHYSLEIMDVQIYETRRSGWTGALVYKRVRTEKTIRVEYSW